MVTPVLRVIVAIAGFALQRRWLFVAVSGFVLAVLVTSLFVTARLIA